MLTFKSINCDNFIENLKTSISCFDIKDKDFFKTFHENLNNPIDNDIPDYINVRYRFELENTIVCFDYFGYYSLNGKIRGKYKKFEDILNYIDRNKLNAIPLEELSILKEENIHS